MKDLIKVYLQNIITEDIDIKYPNHFEKRADVDPKTYEKNGRAKH